MFGYRINWDTVQGHVNNVQRKLSNARDTVLDIASQPETKLIAKAAAKSIGGGALIGIASGVALHSVPVAAVVVGIGGSGLWGYHCGKELDKELLELRLKQITESPELMQKLEHVFERQRQGLEDILQPA